MNTGKVKFFNTEKGFGFIIDDATGEDYFVHITEVQGGELSEGSNVEFEVQEGRKGLNAVNVSVIG